MNVEGAPRSLRSAPTDDEGVFVSYAQNLEDVILWRALRHVEAGFYVDVGASSPVVDSVTLAFYERGWHGINVEPHPEAHAELVHARPRDMNLNVALGDSQTQLTMSLAGASGLSTLDQVEASRLASEGMPITEHPVEVTTLRSVWTEHVPADQAVHFLKVDVEGFERQVLLGSDWATHRPWVVVVEATKPRTQELSHAEWEPILIRAGYDMTYWDGLNRYYVAQEHPELASSFDHPPNAFDRYIRVREVAAITRAAEAENEVTELRATIANLRASKSWRITGPFRAGGTAVRHLMSRLSRSGGRASPSD